SIAFPLFVASPKEANAWCLRELAIERLVATRRTERRKGMPWLFAFLVGAIESLGEPLERERVGRLRSLGGDPLHDGVLAGAQSLDQPRLFRHVLDPGAVLPGVERKRCRAYDRARLRIRLERIADDDQDLIADLLGRPRGDEHVRRV